jgi:ketosteroid isomerase-like protein
LFQKGGFALDDAAWIRRVFDSVDAMDTETFLSFFEEDAQFRFGSAPAVTGKEAIGTAVDGFFASIKGLRHEILESWRHPETVICQGQATYTRTDGSELTLPFATIWRMRGDRIKEYLIYLDIQPLYAGAS